MAKAAAAKAQSTVSGPGVDRSYPLPQIGLSAAITFAARRGPEATFYVRDADGDVYGRVERDERGWVFVYRAPETVGR